MLFNSVEFLFYFLPLTLILFFTIAARYGKEPAIALLVVASLFFYGWWNPIYLILLVGSMFFNYFLGQAISDSRHNRILLTFGVITNLGFLAYYKYAGFFVTNINVLFDTSWNFGHVFLPLAISFFTFQQIAYLVDSYKGITREYSFLHYLLFVSFFPQLIAGPIVHHKEMLPQFSGAGTYRFNARHFSIGLSIFAIGLFKKTVLADGIAEYANPIFTAADGGQTLDFFTAWGGALCYTFQLYFDFSGYSDMAIGLARMFGIVLPLNFYSPYKAANISEFWRRWHMTLSRFLRDYIYIPLGGNRKGIVHRYKNLFITMLLGGLWHGAGWNFIIWGALHGGYLTLHQLWLRLLDMLGFSGRQSSAYKAFAWLVTFISVVIGWVFFRATTFEGAVNLLQSMLGFNGLSLPNAIYARLGSIEAVLQFFNITSNTQGGAAFVSTWCWILLLTTVSLCLPTTQDIFSRVTNSLDNKSFDTTDAVWPAFAVTKHWVWSPTSRWALLCAMAFVLGLITLGQVSEFLYFQF